MILRTERTLPLLFCLFILCLALSASANSTRRDHVKRAIDGKVENRHFGRALSSRHSTNAERFRKGLPPLPPSKRGDRKARGPATSQIPCVPLTSSTGTIGVYKRSDGSFLGYLSKVYDINTYTFTTFETYALHVSLPSTSPFNSVFDLPATNAPDPANPLVGGVGGGVGYYFQSGSDNFAFMSGVTHTDAGSPPSFTATTSEQRSNFNNPSESQIWSIDCNGVITAQWTNADGTNPPTYTCFMQERDYLGLCGDVVAWSQHFNETAFVVDFIFSPDL